MYFSATIFALLGFHHPTLPALSVACTNFLFTLVAFAAIDRIGRRRILLYSVPVMVLGLAACSVAFGFVEVGKGEEEAEVREGGGGGGAGERGGGESGGWAAVILMAMTVYVASYAVGMGNVPWQQSEYVVLLSRSPPHLLLGSRFFPL